MRDAVDDGRRGAGGDTAATETTGTILRRLLRNLRLMAQVYALAAARDLRFAVRDIVSAAVLLSTVMMLGFYLIALLVAAAVLALSQVLPAWGAALIVFGCVAVTMGLLLLITATRLRRIVARMRATVRAAKEDARWFRTRILRMD
ncbi:MAG TPA: phage holin family protein [bacterium]|nr:phage holin family protein [bacterium]